MSVTNYFLRITELFFGQNQTENHGKTMIISSK